MKSSTRFALNIIQDFNQDKILFINQFVELQWVQNLGLDQVKTISGPSAAARTGQGAGRRDQDRLGAERCGHMTNYIHLIRIRSMYKIYRRGGRGQKIVFQEITHKLPVLLVLVLRALLLRPTAVGSSELSILDPGSSIPDQESFIINPKDQNLIADVLIYVKLRIERVYLYNFHSYVSNCT